MTIPSITDGLPGTKTFRVSMIMGGVTSALMLIYAAGVVGWPVASRLVALDRTSSSSEQALMTISFWLSVTGVPVAILLAWQLLSFFLLPLRAVRQLARGDARGIRGARIKAIAALIELPLLLLLEVVWLFEYLLCGASTQIALPSGWAPFIAIAMVASAIAAVATLLAAIAGFQISAAGNRRLAAQAPPNHG